MTDLLDVGWTVNGTWLWGLLIVPTTWLVRLFYRHTRPGVRPGTERTLWLLRAGSLAILLLLLTEPLLSYLARHAQRPTIVTVVDTSPSMGVVEDGRQRFDRVREALEGELGDHLGEGPLRGFAGTSFDIDADTLSRLQPAGLSTDLGSALTAARDAIADHRTLGGLVLLSDGGHNLGPDPVTQAADLGIPVYALGVGSKQPSADVQLLAALAPDEAVAGRQSRMPIVLRSWGFDGTAVEILISTEEQVLTKQEVRLRADGQLLDETINIPPLLAGPHILRVAIAGQEGEVSLQNNQRLVFLHVRQQRLRALLLAGGPGPEVAFLRRTLEADSTMEVTSLIRRDERSFYGGVSGPGHLTEWDVVVLVEPDDGLLQRVGTGNIRAFLDAGRGLLAFVRPRGLVGNPVLATAFPLVTGSTSVRSAEDPLVISPKATHHPLGRLLAASATPDREIRLPPLSNYARRLKPADGVTVLLQTASGDPVVVAGPVGRGRVVYAVGSGFWRLELFGAGLGDTGVDLGAFWQAATRWLAAAPASGRVRSSPEQPVYRAGETAAVIAEVYDELNEPLDNVVVTVGLQPGNRDVTMEGVGAGRYRATWSGLDPGEYSYRIDVRDPTDGTSQGRFVVESQSVEAMDLRADPALLVNLAATSGGEYRPLERWRDLQSRLKPPPRLIREERRLSATIHQGTWLVLCVVLLTAEWLLRKRSGML